MVMGTDGLAPEDVAWQLVTASWTTHAVRTMAVLGIADKLASGPQSIDALAEATGTHAPTLARLVNVLVSLGLCSRVGTDAIALTSVGQFLRGDIPGSAAPFALGVMAPHFERAWHALPESVRTGNSVYAGANGLGFWDYLVANPEDGARFDAAMSSGDDFARILLAARDLSGVQTLVDIGGGQGRTLAALLTAKPDLRGILFDQPEVVARAEPVLSEAGVSERCAVVGGDFFAEVPAGGDAYLLGSILHDWPDAEAVQILLSCHRAMMSGARIWLLENVVMPDADDLWTSQLDLLMLVLFGAQERTADQFQALLEAAGFTQVSVFPGERAIHVIEAVKG